MRTEKIRVRMLAGLLAAGLVLSLPAGGALALGEGTFTEETVNSDALAQNQNSCIPSQSRLAVSSLLMRRMKPSAQSVPTGQS